MRPDRRDRKNLFRKGFTNRQTAPGKRSGKSPRRSGTHIGGGHSAKFILRERFQFFIRVTNPARQRHKTWILKKFFLHEFQLLWKPYVILVREENDFALASFDRLLKILRKTEISFVPEKSNGKRRARCPLFQNGESPVGRAIVTDDDFIRQVRLTAKRFQLFRKESLSVKSAEGYRGENRVCFGHKMSLKNDVRVKVQRLPKHSGTKRPYSHSV